MWKYHSEDIFCQVFYQLKRVNFGISTWKHKLSDGTNECPWCWKVLRAGGVPELHQENCWDQPLPTVTWQILHRTLPFPILSFILTFTKVPRIIPFPVITPGCSAALLQDLLFFFFFCDWLILVLKNSLGLFCIFSQQEKLAGLHYIFMLLHFPKALRLNMNPKSLLIIHTSYVLGAAAIIHTDMGYNASVPS